MTRKRSAIMALGILGAISAIGIATVQRAQNDDNSERATPVKKGVMTERQREHSTLFSHRSTDSKSLTDSEEPELRLTIGSEEGGFSFEDRQTLNDIVRERICESDAILVGKVTAKESQLTLGEDFIFTDYTIAVETLLKDDAGQSLRRANSIIVTRAGGKVALNGRTITVVDRNAGRLLIGGKYLMFLKRIPKTGAYTTLPGSSSISDSDGQLTKLTDQRRGEFSSDVFASSVIDLIGFYKTAPCECKP